MAVGGSSRIEAIGSDRPLLKDLYDHVANNVAYKWKDLGVQLLRSDQLNELNTIAANHPQDVVRCCKCVLEKWVETNTGATWNQLIEVLNGRSLQLNQVAGKLEQMLIPELAIISTIDKPVCEKLTSILDIEPEFAKMTSEIKKALIKNNIEVATLIEQLCAISAVKNKKVPIFDEDVFEKIKSIDDFWKKLRGFWTIFDYELLRFVVEISRCKEVHDIFKEFLSRIDPSAIEDVDLVLHCKEEYWEGSLKPVLRIKVKTEKCTSNIKRMVEETVSKVYNLDKYALHFYTIKKGCVELNYYVSQSLKSYLLYFDITRSIMVKFSNHNIVDLCIDEFKLTNLGSKSKSSPPEQMPYYQSETVDSSTEGEEVSQLPDYSDRIIRLQSFKHWVGVLPTQLAEEGFYMIAHRDMYMVRCFSCGIVFCNLERIDNIIDEHHRLSPNCLFLRQICTFRGNIEESWVMDYPPQSLPLSPQGTSSKLSPEGSNESYHSAESHRGNDYSILTSLDPPEANITYEESLSEGLENNISIKTGDTKGDDMGAPGMGLCQICYDKKIDCIFLPCGHARTCEGCATKIKNSGQPCPYCRKFISDIHNINL